MPTQEERLGAVEYGMAQFKTESIQAHQEVAMELTLVKGLTHDSIRRITELKIEMKQRFDAVDQRFDAVDQQIAGMKQDIGGVHQKLDRLEKLIVDRLPSP